jgi:Kef-type K+ transport system membrane component KefB
MIIVGLFGGLVAHRFKFPRVTGYIVIGIVLSPTLTGVIAESTVDNLEIFTSIALGIIAYSIGGSLQLEKMRKLENSIAWITPLQAIGTWFLTALVVTLVAPFIIHISNSTLLRTYFPMAFVIGAIASATAPATIMAIVREYKAKGPLTTTLLSIVAIDDGVAIILFSIATGVASALAGMAEGLSLYGMFGSPVLEILQSIAIGAVLGFTLIHIAKLVKNRSLLLVAVLGAIMLCVGIADILEVSLILANMVLGVIVCNTTYREEMFGVIDDIEDAIFAIFFVLAGLHFDLKAMHAAGLIAVLIFMARFAAKYFGTMAGAQIARSPEDVKKYLGLALMPAAGVSIGLALLAQRAFPDLGSIIYNAILATVVINELIGPPLTKLAIFKAGEQNAE